MERITKSLCRIGFTGGVLLLVSGCAYQVGYDPTCVPEEEPVYLSAEEVLLAMPDEHKKFVNSGNPSIFSRGGSNMTMPIGVVLKEAAAAFRGATMCRPV